MLEGCTPWPEAQALEYVRAGYWGKESIGQALGRMAALAPHRPFLSDAHGQLSYSELDRLSDALAHRLTDLGLQPRDIVLLQMPNVREMVLVFFALQKIGVVPVMCLPAHRYNEIVHFAEITQARAHFFSPGFRGFDFIGMAREVQAAVPSLQILVATGEGNAAGVTYLGPLLDDVAQADEGAASTPKPLPMPDAREVAFMLLSGGTTGVPKLIPRTHADYLYNARACAEVLDWDSATSYLISLPAAHNFALGAPGMIAALAVGGSIVLCPSTDADDVFGSIERLRATVMPATPALVIALLGSPQRGRYDLSSLRQICVGGQRMLPELFDRLQAAFPEVALVHAFGMAEGLTNLSRPGDAAELKRHTQGRPVSPGDEIRIIDDEGADVPDGEVGELITRGPYTIRGYYRGAEHNRSAFTDEGYYRTGDLVRMHPSGNLIVEGRKKDLINRGGEKISAEEVENFVLSHPGVRSVAVVAMPDPVMGERSCAFVILKDGVSLALPGLCEFLMAKRIAKFKLPERLEVLEAFPLTAMGKVSKKGLRDLIAQRLSEEAAAAPAH